MSEGLKNELKKDNKTGMILAEEHKKKADRKIYYIITVIIVMIILTLVIGISIYNLPEKRLARQLDLGWKFLEKMNYEQAIVEFDKAIEIDPMNVEAYLGKVETYLKLGDVEQVILGFDKILEIDPMNVEAYLGKATEYIKMEDYEQAINVLNLGYEKTGNEKINNKIIEIKSMIEKIEQEKIEREKIEREKNKIKREEIEEILELYIDFRFDEEEFLSYEQIEEAYLPLAGQLEGYVTDTPEDADAWEVLSWLYCEMDKLEICLETRKRAYLSTNNEHLIPEMHTEFYDDGGKNTYDEYGRLLNAISVFEIYTTETSFQYYKGNRLTSEDDSFVRVEYQYDKYGRTEKETVYNDNELSSIYEYEYENDNSVIVKSQVYWSESSYTWKITKLEYDKYGDVITEEFIDSGWSE